ncbi:MAG: NPCBM/NEW2 domain-containing protein [Pirellulaceae bacterium]
MADDFDPYYKWLAIPPAEQPPNHYRLLGVPLFTDDPDVIENAAEQRTRHVRSFQLGGRAALSQKVLNQISAAQVCLLNPDQKAAYDAKLRSAQAAAKAPTRAVPVAEPLPTAPVHLPTAPAAVPMQPPMVQAASDASTRHRVQGKRSAERKTQLLMLVIAGVAAAALGLFALVMVWLATSGGETADDGETVAQQQVGADDSSPAEETPETEAPPPTPENSTPLAQAGADPAETPAEATVAPENPDSPTSPVVETPPVTEPSPATAPVEPSPSGPAVEPPPTTPSPTTVSTPAPTPDEDENRYEGWTDVLAWAEGVDWKSRGYDWNLQCEEPPSKSGVTLRPTKFNRYPLPAVIDGDYEMEVEFTRHMGRESVNVFFPVGMHNMHLELGARTGTVGGVHWIDGQGALDGNPTTRRPSRISNGEKHRIAIRVRQEGDQAEFEIDWDEEKNYITWSGEHTRLIGRNPGAWKLTTIRRPWVGSFENRVTFHGVHVRMLSGEVHKDVVDEEERAQDLAAGFVRLVGEPTVAPTVGLWQYNVNQIPLEDAMGVDGDWPLIAREFAPCREFLGAHAPSRLKCAVPKAAKSFSAFGYNDGSRTTKYQVYVDGALMYESGPTAVAPIKFDLPPKAAVLELLIDDCGNDEYDRSYWCYPRFHAVEVEKLTDKMISGIARTLPFQIVDQSVGWGKLTRNQPFKGLWSIPVHPDDATPCDEFVFAVPDASVTFAVPEGMTRFTAIGYNLRSHHVKYEVWADARQLYVSPQAGIVPINVKLPPGARTIELKIDKLGNYDWDHAMWCYPRLHKS